jgi:hypothetical protein
MLIDYQSESLSTQLCALISIIKDEANTMKNNVYWLMSLKWLIQEPNGRPLHRLIYKNATLWIVSIWTIWTNTTQIRLWSFPRVHTSCYKHDQPLSNKHLFKKTVNIPPDECPPPGKEREQSLFYTFGFHTIRENSSESLLMLSRCRFFWLTADKKKNIDTA